MMTDKQLQEHDILKEPMAVGEMFSKSGLFPDVKDAAKAAVKIMAGKEIGLTPFQAMSDIYIVNGKLALMSNAMAALVKGHPKYDYKVEEHTEEKCVIKFLQVDGDGWKELGDSTFTFKDAAKAGIVNKDVWKNYPRNMLFARALANGVRWYCPDVACGWHAKEEMDDVEPVKDTGTITISSSGVTTDES
jgi:hypothetical protein